MTVRKWTLARALDALQGRSREAKFRDFMACCAPGPDDLVLDVGASGDEGWGPTNTFLHRFPHPARLTVLGIDDCRLLRTKYEAVRFVTYSGGRFPFADKEFDICHSNAVIEHVGGRSDQQLFVNEMVRVARRGFFTTPNRWFPLDLHTRLPFLHYLSYRSYQFLARPFPRGRWAEGVRFLARRDIEQLLRSAQVRQFRIITNRLALMTVTYSVYWQCAAGAGLH